MWAQIHFMFEQNDNTFTFELGDFIAETKFKYFFYLKNICVA